MNRFPITNNTIMSHIPQIPLARFSLDDVVIYNSKKFVISEMSYREQLGIVYSLSIDVNQKPVETQVCEAALKLK